VYFPLTAGLEEDPALEVLYGLPDDLEACVEALYGLPLARVGLGALLRALTGLDILLAGE